MNHIYISKKIKKELEGEGIKISEYTVRRTIRYFLENTVKALLAHNIIDWIYFQYQYDIRRLRRYVDKNSDKFKTKHF